MVPSNALGRAVRRHLWKGVAVGLGAVLFVLAAPTTEAHKGITSRYNYNVHIFPILRDRCGSCHYDGGPAPMSLVDYIKAVPWAESIREHLVSERMPPWYVDPTGPAVRGGSTISTKELDMLLTWVVGGSPRLDEKSFVFGPMAGVESPSYAGPPPGWSAGPPDLKVAMPTAHTVAPGTIEEDIELTIPTGLTEERWVKAVDLLPGERSMVRDAVIAVENGPVLAAWVPGHEAIEAPSGTAFRVPAGAKLTVKIHYKKNYNDEQKAMNDTSTVGLYFTDAPLSGRSMDELRVAGPTEGTASFEPRTFNGAFTTAARVVAVRPSFDDEYESMQVDAVAPNGRRVPILSLRRPQPQWYRRYWLAEPVEVPAGTKLEVTVTPAVIDDMAPLYRKRYPLQVSVDYVAY